MKRFASAGCDNLVKIWGFREDSQQWVEEEILEGHTDWVRDVAWAPNIGLPRSYIATASQVCFLPPVIEVHSAGDVLTVLLYLGQDRPHLDERYTNVSLGQDSIGPVSFSFSISYVQRGAHTSWKVP